MSVLDEILALPGFTPALLPVGAVMYAAWTAAYVSVIRQGCRQKTYGVPMVSLCLNVVWETIFSFNLTGAKLPAFFVWGNRFWLAPDVVILALFFLYGRENQTVPWVRRYFYPVAVGTLVAAAVGLPTFTLYFNDLKGVASSMFMNLAMSAMYFPMLWNRPDLRGLGVSSAWLKMLGTAAGSVFLYHWWPAQFDHGVLTTHRWVREPGTFSFMLFLYVGIFVLDCVYIALLTARKRALAAAPPPGPATAG